MASIDLGGNFDLHIEVLGDGDGAIDSFLW
jgi:hypothetical protein